MQMTLRWYGSKFDTVTLKQIRQIPGVTGVISTLYDSVPGEAWTLEDILALKKEIEDAGLQLAGIESVNIHDAIKTGAPDRDTYIDNYITTLENQDGTGPRTPRWFHRTCIYAGSSGQTESRGYVRFHFRGYQRQHHARMGAGTHGKDQRPFRHV